MNEHDLSRILRLQGTDEGFYCLALQSCIEKYLNRQVPELALSYDFTDKLQQFRGRLEPLSYRQRQVFSTIERDRRITNRVRHEFQRLTFEEAAAMTHNLLRFRELAGIPDADAWLQLDRGVQSIWEDSRTPLQQQHELRQLRSTLQRLQHEQQDFQEQLAQLERVELAERHLKAQLTIVESKLQEATAAADTRKQRIDDLRQERHSLQAELRKDREQAARLAPVREQLAYLERLSSYSRTRRDYERSVIRLTPEQADVLERISLNQDYLVRGNAGTGKTLVLLKALQKAAELSAQEEGLGLESDTLHMVLLTYTTTLVRYNRYLAEIMDQHRIAAAIQTADSLLRERLQRINPEWDIEYRLIHRLCKEYNTTDFLSTSELDTEIEDFIFGGAVTRAEYIDQRIPRSGLKLPLNSEQREQVWAIRNRIVSEMEDRQVFSKGYACTKLLQHLRENDAPELRDIGYVFIDETQDLRAVELMVLKELAARPLIMAGDSGQSIYGFRSPYARAGIRLTGRSKTLKLNFRSTAAIHEFAEAYRDRDGSSHVGLTAFREGPVPELIRSSDKPWLLQQIVDRAVFFVERLGYDPENICILAPQNKDLERISDELGTRSLESANIKNSDFSFEHGHIVRLSTLHSSKGLDFPVVLLYLPQLFHLNHLDPATIETMERNLLYVACTRAMDHLVIALNPDSSSAAIRDLAAAGNPAADEA